MSTIFNPEINKVYFINQYTLLIIKTGTGSIQVDFENYFNWQDKGIYLSKGQYIKFLSDDFEVYRIEFPSEALFTSKDVRVLFKHLISLGYVDFLSENKESFLSKNVLHQQKQQIIDFSTRKWYMQDPFRARKEEYQVIFDVKDVIDQAYSSNLKTDHIVNEIESSGYNVPKLVKEKLGLSINALMQRKKLLEIKKEIAFSTKTLKEICYDNGFNDPSYFNRFFKHNAFLTPNEFRENFDYENRDVFLQNFMELIKKHHKTEHNLGFYAEKLNLSVKALQKKVKAKTTASPGQLIRQEIIKSARTLLEQDENITEVAYLLGFEEPQHFSAFFKHYTSMAPSAFKSEKYH